MHLLSKSLFFLLLQLVLLATDFDCIIIGSSPFSLFEALYQSHSGKTVLVLEESSRYGGAWTGIDICGVAKADLGCHQIGHDLQLKAFLEDYAGCHIISMDNPLLPFHNGLDSPNGWYFSRGCYELIDNLIKLISLTDIVLLANHKAEHAIVDPLQHTATVHTKDRSFTTNKLILTPMTSLTLYPSPSPQNYGKSKYYHLYLLIQDPTPPRFTYKSSLINGVSRVMNLSHFVDLAGTGRQLIVVQTQHEQNLSQGQLFLEALKNHQLVDLGAYILAAEPYIYEAGAFNQSLPAQIGAQGLIEVLQTGHFQNLSTYIPKWTQTLKPYKQLLGEG